MNKKYSLFYYIFIFVVVQLIWLAIVGLWIARYVANHLILKKIGERYSVHIPYTGSVSILVIGLSLLVLAIIGMSLLFRHLNIQFKRTRMYDNFIANVTHELKTPLSSIKLYLDTIFKRDLQKDQLKKFASRMQDETSRLNELINKILDVAKIDQKEKEYNCEVKEVNSSFQKIFENLKEQYAQIDLETKIDDQDGKIIIDEKAFLSLFKNLIDNSIKYSKKEPEIRIKLSNQKKSIVISYTDNGIGIPAQDEKKIFQKFYRSERNDFGKVRGSGLGLYIVRETVRAHRGKIKATSQGRDQGTIFKIDLPKYDSLNSRQRKKLLG